MILFYWTFMFALYHNVDSASYYFRQLPARFVPWPRTLINQTTATSPEECGSIGENAVIVAIVYYKNGTCMGYNGVLSYHFGTVVAQTNGTNAFAWYLRDTGGGCGCADAVRAQKLLNEFTYGNYTCYNGWGLAYDPVSGYCTGKSSAQNTGIFGTKLAYYTIGATKNDTIYTMTRAQISESVNYDCSEVTPSPAVVYNNIWYCFAIISPSGSDYTLIRDNACAKFQTNGTPVKIVHPLVYGLISFHTGTAAIAGIYYNGSQYVYYDNSTLPNDILWDSGYPTSAHLRMVTVDRVNLSLQDVATNKNVINCLTKVDKKS
uniref:Uncharacterized protein n=1 Tax=Bursaphelenchus xylophilus TaxID=6326 RepID=A0A1I7SLP9_BURXY